MKWRLASIAFLLSACAAGLVWLTVLPVLLRLLDTHRLSPGGEGGTLGSLGALLPWLLGLDLVALTGLVYLVLDVMVGRPLREMQATVERLGEPEPQVPLQESGGPLVSRIQAALRRTAQALHTERSVTGAQLVELQRANAQLVQARTELVAAERLATVGRLAAGIAHEVGNPLAGVLGYLSLVRERAGHLEGVGDYLERVERELQRIEAIVQGLLDLGRPAQARQEVLDLGAAVHDCVRLVRAGPEFQAVDVQVQTAPTIARTDPGPLAQILINLLLNAAEAMDGRGVVSVRVYAQGEHGIIEVEDTGPGLEPGAREHLFEPFFTTKGAGKGSGLGLAVSLHLAQALHGQLSVTSPPGKGACFRLQLPLA